MASGSAAPDPARFGRALVHRAAPQVTVVRRAIVQPGFLGRRSVAFGSYVGQSQVSRWTIGTAMNRGALTVRPPLDYWPWATADEPTPVRLPRVERRLPQARSLRRLAAGDPGDIVRSLKPEPLDLRTRGQSRKQSTMESFKAMLERTGRLPVDGSSPSTGGPAPGGFAGSTASGSPTAAPFAGTAGTPAAAPAAPAPTAPRRAPAPAPSGLGPQPSADPSVRRRPVPYEPGRRAAALGQPPSTPSAEPGIMPSDPPRARPDQPTTRGRPLPARPTQAAPARQADHLAARPESPDSPSEPPATHSPSPATPTPPAANANDAGTHPESISDVFADDPPARRHWAETDTVRADELAAALARRATAPTPVGDLPTAPPAAPLAAPGAVAPDSPRPNSPRVDQPAARPTPRTVTPQERAWPSFGPATPGTEPGRRTPAGPTAFLGLPAGEPTTHRGATPHAVAPAAPSNPPSATGPSATGPSATGPVAAPAPAVMPLAELVHRAMATPGTDTTDTTAHAAGTGDTAAPARTQLGLFHDDPTAAAPVAPPAARPPAPRDPAQVIPRPSPDRFLEVLQAGRPARPVALPARFSPLARLVAGTDQVGVRHDAAARDALAAVGKRAATVGNVIHLAEAPAPRPGAADRATTGVLAHELTHVANPSPVPRFYDDDRSSAEERRAETVAGLIVRSPLLALTAPDQPGHDDTTAPGPTAATAPVGRMGAPPAPALRRSMAATAPGTAPRTRPAVTPATAPRRTAGAATGMAAVARAVPGATAAGAVPTPAVDGPASAPATPRGGPAERLGLLPPPPRFAATAAPGTDAATAPVAPAAALARRGAATPAASTAPGSAAATGGRAPARGTSTSASPAPATTVHRRAITGQTVAPAAATVSATAAGGAGDVIRRVETGDTGHAASGASGSSQPDLPRIIANASTADGMEDLVHWVVEKVEDRVMSELLRRGGRFRGDY